MQPLVSWPRHYESILHKVASAGRISRGAHLLRSRGILHLCEAELNRLLAPFYIKGSGYEEFVTALTEIAHAACEWGARQVQAAGKTLDDIDEDEEARRQFIAACHQGFGNAQSAIAEQVIGLDAKVRTAGQALAAARRNRDKDRARELGSYIEALTNRQLVLRRVVDCIYFTLVNREAYRYNRFLAHRELQKIDVDVLRPAVSFAEARNRENPLKFTVVADLTTGVHMADLVEIDRTNPEPELAIIELKTGETNRILLDMLEKKPNRATVKQLDAMGPKAWEQLKRIVQQHDRLKNAFNVITTDRGFDSLNQAPIVLLKEPVPVEGFLDALMAVCVEADKSGVSDRRIDECLSLVAIREDCGLTITDGLVKHFFYHLDPDTAQCSLPQGTDVADEEVRRVALSPGFTDLGKFQLRNLSGPGLFAMVPTPIALEIVTGELRLFARFDVVRFFEYAERHGITLTWGSRKESAEVVRRKLSAPIPGSPGPSAVVHYRVGEQGKGTLFYGFFLCPFRDLLRPSDLIEMIRARAAQGSDEGDISA
jgi:hypothetical protein